MSEKSQVHIDPNPNLQQAPAQQVQIIEHLVTQIQRDSNEQPSKNTKKDKKKQQLTSQQKEEDLVQDLQEEYKSQLKETKDLFFYVRHLIEQTTYLNAKIDLKKQDLDVLKAHILRIQKTARRIFQQRQSLDQQILQSLFKLIENDQKVIREDLQMLNQLEKSQLKGLKEENIKKTYLEHDKVFGALENKGQISEQMLKKVKQMKGNFSSQIFDHQHNLDEKKKQELLFKDTTKQIYELAHISIQQFKCIGYTLTFEYDQIMDTIDKIKKGFRKLMI